MESCIREQEVSEKSIKVKRPRIIIVGAGASGIAAAARLFENNIADLLILEAEDRIGGRIYSTNFENSIVELGAQYCHGEDANVVYEMVKNLDVLESETRKRPYTPYHSSRKELDLDLFDDLFNTFEGIFYEEKNKYKYSFGEYMIQRTKEITSQMYGNDVDMHATAMEALNTFKIDMLANEGTFSWFDGSADQDYEECDGDERLGWKGRGYKTVLDILTKIYPDPTQGMPIYDKVVLNKEVTKVLWGGTQIKLMCGDETFHADHVIFTPSLGVLKQQHDTLFEPKLPAEKLQAIKTIGIGAALKIYYYFSEAWWPEDSWDFTFVWSEQDRERVLREFPDAVLTNGKSWLLDVLQLCRVTKSCNVLGTWICGENVPEVELLPVDEIINGTMFLMKKFLGHRFTICRPQRILREKWYANKHFRGVYSYQTMESRAVPGDSQEVVLGRPVTSDGVPRLCFAGEATSPTHYGTVHGAIETGWREADRLLQLYK